MPGRGGEGGDGGSGGGGGGQHHGHSPGRAATPGALVLYPFMDVSMGSQGMKIELLSAFASEWILNKN